VLLFCGATAGEAKSADAIKEQYNDCMKCRQGERTFEGRNFLYQISRRMDKLTLFGERAYRFCFQAKNRTKIHTKSAEP